jgi:hypothetical protein
MEKQIRGIRLRTRLPATWTPLAFSYGKSSDTERAPLIQCVRRRNSSPCKEALVREGMILKPADRVYVGKDSPPRITYIIAELATRN